MIEEFWGQIRIQHLEILRKSIIWYLVKRFRKILSTCVIHRYIFRWRKYILGQMSTQKLWNIILASHQKFRKKYLFKVKITASNKTLISSSSCWRKIFLVRRHKICFLLILDHKCNLKYLKKLLCIENMSYSCKYRGKSYFIFLLLLKFSKYI